MRPTGKIHAAKYENSPRLQRAELALRIAGPRGLTTRAWQEHADICNASATASELRENNFPVTCRIDGRSVSGSSIFRYWLAEFAPEVPA